LFWFVSERCGGGEVVRVARFLYCVMMALRSWPVPSQLHAIVRFCDSDASDSTVAILYVTGERSTALTKPRGLGAWHEFVLRGFVVSKRKSCKVGHGRVHEHKFLELEMS
jgi:hypothetical protein